MVLNLFHIIILVTRWVMMLIKLSSFLHRVFPLSLYKDSMDDLIDNRIFKPRKDCKDFELSFPIDWEANNMLQDRNWRMQLQGWAMFFPIMNYFDSYLNKEKILQYFFDVIRDWEVIYGDDPDDIVTSRMPKSYAWYDMSVGFRALVLAFFWNRLVFNNINITENDKNLLEKIVQKHIKHLSNESVFSLNNHGIFQIQGLMALLQLSGIEKYQSEYNYCLDKMAELISTQYDQRGIHLEHSPHYHFYALSAFKNIVKSGWYIEKPIIKELVVKAESAKKWLVDPYNRPACIGDSILTVQKIEKDTNDCALGIKTNSGWLSDFKESGYQIFRSDWNTNPDKATYLFFMGMYHAKSHKHRDCLSFEWFDNGGKIICDSGKYGYVSDKYRNYFLSNRAHNTVEIEGFDILKTSPYGSCINSAREENGKIYFEGALIYPAIEFKRELILYPGKWLIVKDVFSFKRKRNITQWFHLSKDYILENSSNNRLVFNNSRGTLILNSLDNDCNTNIYYGDEDNLQGFISEKDFSYERNYAVGFSKNSILEDCSITVLALNKEGELDALNYLGKNDKNEKVSKVQEIPKRLISGIKHVDRNKNSHRFDLLLGKHTYSYIVDGIQLFFFAHIKENSEKMTVMLPGAVNRSKTLFNFQRFSWSDDVNGSVIIFLDPTVSEENDINIGWFQGDSDNYAIPILESFIKALLIENDIEEQCLTLFGSSAGGFTCLKLADNFLNSSIKVINPQTIVYNYSAKEVNKLVEWIYPNNQSALSPEQKNRLRVSLNLKDRVKPIIYYQNKYDGHHVCKHLDPLLSIVPEELYITLDDESQLDENKSLNIIYYEDEKSGHSPPNKKDTLSLLNS